MLKISPLLWKFDLGLTSYLSLLLWQLYEGISLCQQLTCWWWDRLVIGTPYRLGGLQMVGGHGVVTVLSRHVPTSWTVRPKIPCAAHTSLSLTGLQRPNYQIPAFTSMCPTQQEMSPTCLRLPSSGSTALHLVFDWMSFTTLLAHEIIQQGYRVFLWVSEDAPLLITTKPGPLLIGWLSMGSVALAHGHRPPPNIQAGNSVNVAMSIRWMEMSHWGVWLILEN